MNNAQMTARVGLFFLLGIALIWVVLESLSGEGPLFREKGYNLVATFDDLKQLKAGDEIRIAGVKVGTVRSTRLAGRQAQAVLEITPDVVIAADSTAAVAMAGMLGGNYVAIESGKSPTALAAGAEIGTKPSVDLNAIMTQLGSLGDELKSTLSSVGQSLGTTAGQGGGLFQKIDRLVTENQANVTKSIDNLQAITTEVRNGQGTIGKLVHDPKAYDELVAAIADIRKAAAEANVFLADTRGVVDQVKSGKGAIGTLLYDDKTAADLRLAVQNFRDLSTKLNSGQGTLGKLLSDDSLYRDAQGVIKKADRALGSMEDQGPITAVGVVAGKLF